MDRQAFDMQTRSDVIVRRTYARPLNIEESLYENWEDGICGRVFSHQKWLWERVLNRALIQEELAELEAFKGFRNSMFRDSTLSLRMEGTVSFNPDICAGKIVQIIRTK